MATGFLFAAQIDAVLTWMASHLGLAGAAIGAIIAAYVAVKGWQRWRLARS
jgi:hypothetical protein